MREQGNFAPWIWRAGSGGTSHTRRRAQPRSARAPGSGHAWTWRRTYQQQSALEPDPRTWRPRFGDQRTSLLPSVGGGGSIADRPSAGFVWWPDPSSCRGHPLLASGHLRALEGQDRCWPETKRFSASALSVGGPTLDACFLGLELRGGGGSRDGARRSGSRRESGGSSGCFLHALLSLLVRHPSGATPRGTAFTKAGIPGSGASGPPRALDPLLRS